MENERISWLTSVVLRDELMWSIHLCLFSFRLLFRFHSIFAHAGGTGNWGAYELRNCMEFARKY